MTVTNFIWDELSDNVLMETDDSGTVTAEYHNLPGEFGEPISRRVGFTEHYYHYDGLGSTRQLTNQVQTVTDTYMYSAFGETVASTGSTTNPFRYNGKYGYYADSETGGISVRRRTYSPGSARWLSRDPLVFVDGLNVYTLVGNQPISVSDPSGMSMYRGYFVPNYVDPSGSSVHLQDDHFMNPVIPNPLVNEIPNASELFLEILERIAQPSKGQQIENCVHNCIHEVLIKNTETYFHNPATVEEACRQWCRKKFPLLPPTVIPGTPPPDGITISQCGPWYEVGVPTWGEWELIEKDGCICKYRAKGVQEWVRICQHRWWDVLNWEWSYGKKRSEHKKRPVLKIKEEYCD